MFLRALAALLGFQQGFHWSLTPGGADCTAHGDGVLPISRWERLGGSDPAAVLGLLLSACAGLPGCDPAKSIAASLRAAHREEVLAAA